MTLGEPGPPIDDPLIGQVISERYRILAKLGEGGMGAVYLAEHVFIQKKVALKVLAPELARREDLAARFLQEARAASSIGQENVIDISDFGQSADGLVFFAMEYLEGIDLGGAIRRDGALAWSRARGIVLQICKALRAAHARGIVHRDLKPENIFLVSREGRPDFVKLLDFGIAKVTGPASEEGPRLTRTGMIFGTPEYMAPEQAEGKPVDQRVDIYAVGCVIYHCLSGSPPFAAESFMAMLTKHLLEAPVAPSVRRPDLAIPPALDTVVLKALEKDRARRWQTIDEVMAAVTAIEADAFAATVRPPVTLPLGGGLAAGVVRASASGPRTEVFGAADELQHELSGDLGPSERPGSRPGGAGSRVAGSRAAGSRGKPAPVKVALVIAGVAAGVLAAALWAVHDGGRSPANVVQATAVPVPAAAAGPAPPAPPPEDKARLSGEAPARAARPDLAIPGATAEAPGPRDSAGGTAAGAHDHAKRAGNHRRPGPPAAGEGARAGARTLPPAELKPFPL